MRSLIASIFGIVLSGCGSLVVAQQTEPELRWWKGNLHTHSLWSDGDDFPEMIAAWYSERDYNFLALSDHNILSSGMRWMPLADIVKRSDEGILDRYRQRFSNAWVETRPIQGKDGLEVRLKPLDEFRCLVEHAGQFIMIQGEEVSDSAQGKPVHMNVTNLQQLILPVGGDSVRDVIQNNLRVALEQEETTGRELLVHLNHPNFHYAVTAEDLAHVIQERFFEVYNGHPGVNHLGDDKHISIERMWDVANAIRLGVLDAEPLWGIATDDSHEYHGEPGSRPGRGWVMVRAPFLTPEHLIKALKQADFYASSGVELASIEFDATQRQLTVRVAAADGVEYTTEFIGTIKPNETGTLPAPDEIGKVLATVAGPVASYTLTGNELYVRARITSDQPPADPVFDGQRQQAWTQPVR